MRQIHCKRCDLQRVRAPSGGRRLGRFIFNFGDIFDFEKLKRPKVHSDLCRSRAPLRTRASRVFFRSHTLFPLPCARCVATYLVDELKSPSHLVTYETDCPPQHLARGEDAGVVDVSGGMWTVQISVTLTTWQTNFTLHHLAALHKNAFPIRPLPDDIEQKTSSGLTLLHMAAIGGNLSMVKEPTSLLGKCDNKGRTPAYVACFHGHPDVVRYIHFLRQAQILVRKANGATTLYISAQNGHMRLVKYLVETCPEVVRMRDTNDASALWISCQFGHADIVKYLHNVDPTLVDYVLTNGASCMWIAAQNNHMDIVTYLYMIRGNALPSKNKGTVTCGWIAAQNGNSDISKCVVGWVGPEERSSYLQMCNAGMATRLHVATQNGHLDVVRYLIEIEPSLLHILNHKNFTCLYIASQNGHTDIVWFLMDGYPEMATSVSSVNGITGLWIASQNSNLDIVRVLSEASPGLVPDPTSCDTSPDSAKSCWL